MVENMPLRVETGCSPWCVRRKMGLACIHACIPEVPLVGFCQQPFSKKGPINLGLMRQQDFSAVELSAFVFYALFFFFSSFCSTCPSSMKNTLINSNIQIWKFKLHLLVHVMQLLCLGMCLVIHFLFHGKPFCKRVFPLVLAHAVCRQTNRWRFLRTTLRSNFLFRPKPNRAEASLYTYNTRASSNLSFLIE